MTDKPNSATAGTSAAPAVDSTAMGETQKKAFDGALDLVKLFITLATGTLALTATFLKDIVGVKDGHSVPCKPLLFITWGLMFLSVLSGLFAYGAIIGTLDGADVSDGDEPKPRLSPFDFNIAFWAITQSLSLYLGIAVLVAYVLVTIP